MAAHLLESDNKQHRSLGAAIPSVVLHGALIFAAVHATAHAALKRTPLERAPIVRLQPSTQRPAQRPLPSPAPTKVDGHWGAPVFTMKEPLPSMAYNPNVETGVRPVVSAEDFGNSALAASASGVGTVAEVLSAPEVDRQVVAIPGSPVPVYPEALRAAGVQGTVIAAFVVDTMGRVERGSFRLLEPADDRFVAAVKNSLARTRFTPAESHGAKVRQLVEQPFSFIIQ